MRLPDIRSWLPSINLIHLATGASRQARDKLRGARQSQSLISCNFNEALSLKRKPYLKSEEPVGY